MPDWIVNLVFLIVGGYLGFLFSIGFSKYKEHVKKERLRKMICENLRHILSGMQENEAVKIQGWLRTLDSPQACFLATGSYPRLTIIEELREELYLFKDPLPEQVLKISRLLKWYRELHETLVRRCTDITRGCQTFEECLEKLLNQQYKGEFLRPVVVQIEEIRKNIVETTSSTIVLLS